MTDPRRRFRSCVFSKKGTKNPKFFATCFSEFRAFRVVRGQFLFLLGCTFAVISALLMPAFANAQSACVRLTNERGIARTVPIQLGDTLRLRFRHSIYGSQVEELFTLRPDGFALTQLRYSEARLVDFYGYESSTKQNDQWVVTPAPKLIPVLNLNLSADASMSIHFDRQANSNLRVIQPTGALRLTVASCQSSAHD